MPLDLEKLAVHELIWVWRNAIWLAERDPSRRGSWGGSAVSIRLILRALAAAMQMTRSPQAEFGCRDLAVHAKISYRTAAAVLAILRSEDDPLIVRVTVGRGLRADRYRLRIPRAYKEDALWYRWRSGVIAPVHPVFRILGGTAFLVYDVLGAEAVPVTEIARAAAVSPATVRKAAGVLGEHGMAVREGGGWRRGPAAPDRGDSLSTPRDLAQLVRLWRHQRVTGSRGLRTATTVRSDMAATDIRSEAI